MPRRLRRLAPALLGLGSLLASVGPLRAGHIDFPICGDNVVQAPYETCDDGNTLSGDGCSGVSCHLEVCGDDILNVDPAPGPAEECDDGNTVDDDGCTFPGCQLDCGDGEVDPGATPPEACDPGSAGESATCDDDCTAAACGDENVNEAAGEECDDGNTVDADGCNADCTLNCGLTPQPQAKCVSALGRTLTGVARARSGDDGACLRRAAAGGPPLADCLGLDLRGKVARASQKTLAAEARECGPPNTPSFAYTSGATVNAAGNDAAEEAFAVLLGAAPTVALRASNRAGARCQDTVLERHQALLTVALGELARATRDALRGSRLAPPVCTSTQLAAALETTLATSRKVAKATDALRRRVGRRCAGVDVAALFDCGAAASLDALLICVESTALRAACEGTAEAEGLTLDCD